MKNFLYKNWHIILLSIFGVIGGYVYWRFIGCTTGSCPITSNWHTSSIAGGIMGYLSGSIISDHWKKPKEKTP